MIIIDEFHNLPKTSLTDESNYLYKLLHSNFNVLYLSATPIIYESENNNDEQLDTDEILCGSDRHIIYTIGMGDATEKKIVCDYKIWLPSIHEDNSKLNEELNIYGIDSVIKAKCNFILFGSLNTVSKKQLFTSRYITN